MVRGTDDDALAWEGDDDPTLDVGAASTRADRPVSALPAGFTAVGRGSEEVERFDVDATAREPEEPVAEGGVPVERGPMTRVPMSKVPMSSATLIAIGILGGVYLIYAIGWVIGGLRLQGHAQYLVTDVMFQGSFWLAVLAPLLWFGTVFLLTLRAKPWVRIAWLLAGVALLLPWPFILLGAVGL